MPGAGSMIAGNPICNGGAKDGTEIGMRNAAAIHAFVKDFLSMPVSVKERSRAMLRASGT